MPWMYLCLFTEHKRGQVESFTTYKVNSGWGESHITAILKTFYSSNFFHCKLSPNMLSSPLFPAAGPKLWITVWNIYFFNHQKSSRRSPRCCIARKLPGTQCVMTENTSKRVLFTIFSINTALMFCHVQAHSCSVFWEIDTWIAKSISVLKGLSVS